MPTTEAASPLQPLLQIRNLHKHFGRNKILKGVDLDVHKGEVVSIIGSSGSGKTTLLRCVNLLEEFESGEIYLTTNLLAIARKAPRGCALLTGISRANAP